MIHFPHCGPDGQLQKYEGKIFEVFSHYHVHIALHSQWAYLLYVCYDIVLLLYVYQRFLCILMVFIYQQWSYRLKTCYINIMKLYLTA